MERVNLILLAIASGLVIAVIVLSFSVTFSRELTRELCEDSDGVWNETSQTCGCQSRFQCPPGFYCSPHAGNETGKCRPLPEQAVNG